MKYSWKVVFILWYDSFKTKNSTLIKKNYNNRLNRILKIYAISKPSKTYNRVMCKSYTLMYTLPLHWNFIVLRLVRKNLDIMLIYSDYYFFKTPVVISKNNLKFDLITRQISLDIKYVNNFSQIYFYILQIFYKSLTQPFFKKIKFKGKGYYIYKNIRNTITPQFGYSHRFYLYSFFVKVRFLTKTVLILFGLNPTTINKLSHKLISWRPVNIFTGRGIRFSKQLIYKKSGKVSSYR